MRLNVGVPLCFPPFYLNRAYYSQKFGVDIQYKPRQGEGGRKDDLILILTGKPFDHPPKTIPYQSGPSQCVCVGEGGGGGRDTKKVL